jgi:hypothetical protein
MTMQIQVKTFENGGKRILLVPYKDQMQLVLDGLGCPSPDENGFITYLLGYLAYDSNGILFLSLNKTSQEKLEESAVKKYLERKANEEADFLVNRSQDV